MTICHVLLFWEKRRTTDPIMVCGMRLKIADDGEVLPKGHDFVGELGICKREEDVTCPPCRNITSGKFVIRLTSPKAKATG